MDIFLNVLVMIGGFLAALLIVLLLVAIVIGIYVKIMQRSSKARTMRLNVVIILVLLAFVLLIHFGCVCYLGAGERDIAKAISTGFEELFSAIGGLTFEGQEIKTDNYIVSSIYFGSIAWLAISDVILIVAGVSYPIYSRLLLFFNSFNNKDTDYFIFTYATKDSLLLAESIEEEYRNKKKKYLIIFSSYEITPYDKDNEDHFKISESNYLFITIPKQNFGVRKSLLRSLFGKKANGKALFDFIKKHQVSIFSLAENDKKQGYESKNSDMVFDDIELVLSSFALEKMTYEDVFQHNAKDKRHINYYVLSNSEINFEFYENMLVKNFNKTFEVEKVLRELPPLFNLEVLNEAIMSGEDLVKVRHKGYEDKDSNDTFFYEGSDFINHKEGGQHVLVIGFGMNGQTALGHLFADSIGGALDDKNMFVPDQFVAEVIDKNMHKLITAFIEAHPSYVFNEGAPKKLSPNDGCYDFLRSRYKAMDKVKFEDIVKYMGFPQIFYKKENYNNQEFLTRIDDIYNGKYDSIIISLGDDETTIQCANAILRAIRQRPIISNGTKTQIFVNIRDYHNNGRLCWDEKHDSIIFTNYFVYRFGNASDIYSYETLKFEESVKIDRTYREIGGESASTQFIDWEYNYLQQCGLYERKTNAVAANFGPLYEQYLKRTKTSGGKLVFDLIEEDYKAYEAVKGNDRFFEDLNEPLLSNLKSIFVNEKHPTIEEIHLSHSLANYCRIVSSKDNDYLSPLKVGYYWWYLTQFDHNRWCRHLMMYGRSFTKDFPINAFENTREGREKNTKYWKNYLRLHDCLLPYSTFTNFNSEPKTDYLNYHEEDYDYGVVVAALGLDNKESK